MPDDVLDLIDEIAGLRREIGEEIHILKTRIADAQPETKSGFKRLSMLRHGQVKLTFITANLHEAAGILQDIGAWWKAKAIRTKAYGADMAAAGTADPDVKISLLLKIKAECQNELTNEIPRLTELASRLETLHEQYNEILEK
jgi:hypothetical protein